MKIVCVGDVGVDEYVNLGIRKPGGICLNFAINAISKNTHCSVVSAIGSDIVGEQIKELLSNLHLDASHLKQTIGNTAIQKIHLNDNGDRIFIGYKAGVLNKLKLNKSDLRFILKHDAVFVPLSDGLEAVFESIISLKGNIIKIVDFSQDYEFADFESKDNIIAKYCTNFNIIFIGGSKNLLRLIKKISKRYPSKLFILTIGEKGSHAFYQNKKYFQIAIKAKSIIDTTGCGDAFQAAFVATYLRTNNIQTSLEIGAKQASLTVTHIGATDSLIKRT